MRPNDLVAEWPRITRFFGVPPHVLQHYPTWLVEMYCDAIIPLMAEEQLWHMAASDHPHLDGPSRKKTLRKLMILVTGDVEEGETVDIRTVEGQAALGGLGIEVVIEDV